MGQPPEGGQLKAQPERMNVLTVPSLSVSSGASYYVHGTIDSVPLKLLVDTGAAVSLLSTDVWAKVTAAGSPIVLQQWTGQTLVGVNGAPLCVKGYLKARVSIGGSQFDACFVISSDLFVDAILGLDFIDLHNCVIDCKNKVLFFWLENISVDLQHAGGTRETNFVRLATTQKIVVSPESEMEIMVRPVSDQGVEEGMWMVENDRAKSHGVVVARAIVCPRNGLVPIRIVNPRECSIVLKKGVELAIMEQVTEESVIRNVSTADNMETKNISPAVQETLWSLVSEVGDHISPGDKEQLLALLLEYADVFSVKSGDLGRTSMLQHRIDTGNSLPIHLPPRRLPQARREEARRLMQEMADAGVIEPSEGPWSSPVVLVRKKDGSIRFCVDYRKVNAVTRKDAYPLPRVDDTLDTLGGLTFGPCQWILAG